MVSIKYWGLMVYGFSEHINALYFQLTAANHNVSGFKAAHHRQA